MESKLPPSLRHLVSWSVSILGKAIISEYGEEIYFKIDKVRLQMKKMRRLGSKNWKKSLSILLQEYDFLDKLPPKGQMAMAHSFSAMLELINRCESAYRDFRLSNKLVSVGKKRPESIVFVLTAHPTEARSPECLAVYKMIQETLQNALKKGQQEMESELFHLLKLVLRISMARETKPTVLNEATNIFENVLNEDILSLLIEFQENHLSVMFRSWVGGDKDGHPGVDEKTMLQTLSLSRTYLLNFIGKRVNEIESEAKILKNTKILKIVHEIKETSKGIKKIYKNDGIKVLKFIDQFKILENLGIDSNPLKKIFTLIKLFPALVLPLEIREDSGVIALAKKNPKKFAIGRMLITLKEISKGIKPKRYIRGFILSMVKSEKDLENGIILVKKTMGKLDLPVVPLFETKDALKGSQIILEKIFSKYKKLAEIYQENWHGRYEVMLGYSDSAKEIGVFPSRFLISQTMSKIDRVIQKQNLIPVFFHGSGGSVERGGGSIKEQTSWWPKSSLNIFKATVQGEMVARSFASPNILKGQIYKIAQQINVPRKSQNPDPILKIFSEGIENQYQKIINDPSFLEVVEKASPYLYLKELKMGSRPTSRNPVLRVGGLRAIPWILCWTQTRALFPAWWGIGITWESMDKKQKNKLIEISKTSELFSSFIKVLGFTLAKVDLSIWRLYLEKSGLPEDKIEKIFKEFYEEFNKTLKFFHQISGKKDLLWHRPWLGASIKYRSSMIHPLNVLQLLALKNNNSTLLRETVTGVACGMLTTG
jgi:phosphoenolpyruvate carboxylase